ncbi:35159_t:CDS:2 [Gigaspora margarita]|uniref:35159_t:CDS:1 n=1 Tax=Gigaspora margarita TaxID=4874 RepID=A0ABN7V7W6_GIGMA|nr:35159_t:CDS:2 [Gigaspora margarita]
MKILSKGIIDPNLYCEVWSKVWWETVSIKLETKMKQFVIPYCLHIYIKYVLNQKSFIITVLPDKENPLKSGFQYTCDSFKSKIECTHQWLLMHVIKKFLKQKLNILEKLNVEVSSIGNLNEGKFYGVGAELVCKNKIKEKTLDEVWNKVEIYKKYTRTYLFEIINELVQKHIEILRSESPFKYASQHPLL